MKRLLLSLFAVAALLFGGLASAQVTTDATKTGVPVATAIGSGTFAQMKTLTCSSSVNDGAIYNVTNYGRGGSQWRCAGSVGDWFPTSPLKVYENTALITGVAQTADQLLLAIPMEAGLLANKVFRTMASFGKTGATDASGTFTFRMGTAGTTADAGVASTSASLGASNRSVSLDFWNRMASATSVNKLGGVPSPSFGGGASGTLLNAATAVANVTSQTVYITLTTTMAGTTDTPQLGYVAVEIQP